jgi:hypothetical protein
MFCNACGTPLQPGQSFCPRCAKPVAGAVPALPGRVARHARTLGVLWMIYSALHLVGGLVLFIVANTVFGPVGPEHQAPPFIRPLLTMIGVLLLATGIIGIASGYGVMQRLPWARITILVLAFLALFSFPFGTALGIYSIWVLLSSDAEREFRAASAGML